MAIDVTTTVNTIVVNQSQVSITSADSISSISLDRVRNLSDLEDVDLSGKIGSSVLIFDSGTGKFEASGPDDSSNLTSDGGDF